MWYNEMHALQSYAGEALRSDGLVQAIRAQLQHALASGVEASASAYSQAAEEASQDAERSIFENGAVNALYRLVACPMNDTNLSSYRGCPEVTPLPKSACFCHIRV